MADEDDNHQSDISRDLRDRLEELQDRFLKKLQVSLSELMKEVASTAEMNDLRCQSPLSTSSYLSSSYLTKTRQTTGTDRTLPERVFMNRRSLLTEMFESEHIRTIYHIFIAIMILLFLNTVVYDFVESGKIWLDFELILWTFGNFHTVMAIWAVMFLSSILLVYPGFHYWSVHRKDHSNTVLWDWSWLSLLALYFGSFFYYPVRAVIDNELPPASSSVIMMEQVRLLMKMYAFIRSNVPRALDKKQEKDCDQHKSNVCPDFSKYLYFLFAPTLVYKDEYPRSSPNIQWQYVFSNLLQVVGCLFYVYFVFVRFCSPVFRKFGQEPFSGKNLVLSVFGCMLPAALLNLCGFFAMLHSWLNAWAEMLTFGDRMFYRDWWNSTGYANYYRTWNVVVHDWLYTYIFKDVYEQFASGSPQKRRLIATLSVFVISAVIHEYILIFIFRFVYPILLLMFGGLGVAFYFIPNYGSSRTLNVIMWVTLFMGLGLLISLYSMEWYARRNCDSYVDSIWDYFIPRSWTCSAWVS